MSSNARNFESVRDVIIGVICPSKKVPSTNVVGEGGKLVLTVFNDSRTIYAIHWHEESTRFLDAVVRLVEAYLPPRRVMILARLSATNHEIWNTGSIGLRVIFADNATFRGLNCILG